MVEFHSWHSPFPLDVELDSWAASGATMEFWVHHSSPEEPLVEELSLEGRVLADQDQSLAVDQVLLLVDQVDELVDQVDELAVDQVLADELAVDQSAVDQLVELDPSVTVLAPFTERIHYLNWNVAQQLSDNMKLFFLNRKSVDLKKGMKCCISWEWTPFSLFVLLNYLIN